MNDADKRWTNPEPPLPFDADAFVAQWRAEEPIEARPNQPQLPRPPQPTECKLDDSRIGTYQRFSPSWIPLILGTLIAFASYVMRFGIDAGILLNAAFWAILVSAISYPIYQTSKKQFHFVTGCVLLVLACGDAGLAIYANQLEQETLNLARDVVNNKLSNNGPSLNNIPASMSEKEESRSNFTNQLNLREPFTISLEELKANNELYPETESTLPRPNAIQFTPSGPVKRFSIDEFSAVPDDHSAKHSTKHDPRYKDSQHGFSINFPEGWKIKGSSVEGTIVKAVRRDDRGRLAFMSVASFLTDAKNVSDLSWEKADVVNQIISDPGLPPALRRMVKVNVLGMGKTRINNRAAVWASIEVMEPAIFSGFMVSHHLVHNGKLFRIMCTTDHEKSWFDQNIEAFQAALESFDFLEN